ncbi:hypothetical protein CVH10_23950, partial [Halomonas sp. ND22Bw]
RAVVWTLMELNLSEKTVSAPIVLRGQPSGTDTVNRLSGEVKVTYTWLSGMSPAGLSSGAALGTDDEELGTVPVVDGPWP